MGKIEEHLNILAELQEWETYLLANSGLPGPRANLELLEAWLQAAPPEKIMTYTVAPYVQAQANTPEEFLVVCGVAGLGRLIADGNFRHLKSLREFASDERWRVREAVAIGLQKYGEKDMDSLLREMQVWSQGNPQEKRAALAALCEPRLLIKLEHGAKVLEVLDLITGSIETIGDRKTDGFLVLKKGLAYGWSVAVTACPAEGKRLFAKWCTSGDKDIRWIMKENLKKNRLLIMDPIWVKTLTREMEAKIRRD